MQLSFISFNASFKSAQHCDTSPGLRLNPALVTWKATGIFFLNNCKLLSVFLMSLRLKGKTKSTSALLFEFKRRGPREGLQPTGLQVLSMCPFGQKKTLGEKELRIHFKRTSKEMEICRNKKAPFDSIMNSRKHHGAKMACLGPTFANHIQYR